jgi:hypothetical protein
VRKIAARCAKVFTCALGCQRSADIFSPKKIPA